MAKVVAAIPGGGWYAEWQDADACADSSQFRQGGEKYGKQDTR